MKDTTMAARGHRNLNLVNPRSGLRLNTIIPHWGIFGLYARIVMTI